MNRNKNFKTIVMLSALFLLVSVFVADAAEFVIFHTSDTHGSIAAHDDPTARETPKPLIGGFAALKSVMNKYKSDPAYSNSRFLYFDSGDMFQGTPIVDRTKGSVMIDLMNQMPLNATTLGNHEFDYTFEMLAEQMKCAKYSLICCNVFNKKTNKPIEMSIPYAVYAHEGKKIGVIGFSAPETPLITFARNVKDLYFKEPADVIEPLISTLKKAKVDFVIALSHLGHERDLKLARDIEGIDLILGGHSHTLKKDITYAGPNNTPIVHSGASCENTSVVTVNIDDCGNNSVRMVSIPLLVDEVGEDKHIKAATDEYLFELNKEMKRVIGESKINLYRGISGGNSPEGTFISEAMRHCSGADIAFTNFGGVRQPLYKGKITIESIFLVQPFDNCIEILDMTGLEVKDLAERAISNKAVEISQDDIAENLKVFNQEVSGTKLKFAGNYGYLYPAGLIITFDPTKEPMKRVTKITTDTGKELEDNKIYKVAFSDFVANGGDGYGVLRTFKNRTKTDLLIRDAMIKYIGELGTITTKPAPTMINLKLTQKDLE
ncbi:MAG: bifunctional UDP-sugar hydrolase/5'-nucleotidase [Candidatus Riflebacteria bacterium]|nr:bifunctional UDP-sugar hydrolase/5'-nucleotidase [Candidatus Riflebacteria bacterium]